MLTTLAHTPSSRRLLAGTLVLAFGLAACGAAAAPSPTPAPATPQPTPTAVPGEGGGGSGSGTDPGSGGGSGGGTGSGNTGGGIIIPIPGDPNQNPLFGEANYVTPAQGLVDQRPVNVQLVRAIVREDGGVTVDLRWWSGVAPCNQLDHVEIVKDDAARTVQMKVVEGSGPGDMVCIDLAELRASSIDLGTLASGTWTIAADGDAPAIKLDVP